MAREMRAERGAPTCGSTSPHGSPCGRSPHDSGRCAAYAPRPSSLILERWERDDDDAMCFCGVASREHDDAYPKGAHTFEAAL